MIDASTLDALATFDGTADTLVGSAGRVFARFDAATQDSGNVSYGVDTPAGRFFVKTAGDPADTRPSLDFPARLALLRNAVRMHAAVTHPALVPLRNVIEAPDGPLLVYDWADGAPLWSPANQRHDPSAPLARFRALRVTRETRVLHAVDAILDLHATLAAAGWIACDFYDGSLLYDFQRHVMHVVDLDSYHHGPTTNTMGRMFGSSRYMAPEEHVLGAPLDERTTVFTLGRMLFELLGDGSDDPRAFRGSPAQHAVALRACTADRAARYERVAAMLDAWRSACRARLPPDRRAL